MTKNKKEKEGATVTEIEREPSSDKQLLKIYMEGFKDELLGEYDKERGTNDIEGDLSTEDLNKRAYSLGALHAMVGDDGKMQDYELTNKDILKILRG